MVVESADFRKFFTFEAWRFSLRLTRIVKEIPVKHYWSKRIHGTPLVMILNTPSTNSDSNKILKPPNDYSAELLQRFKKALEESIQFKVLPSLCDKDGAPLLVELLQMWTNYKAMTKCLGGFFLYLDRLCTDRTNAAPLQDLAASHFHDLVCKHIQQRMFSAAASLVAQDRNGQLIDSNLLQNISAFFVEIGGQEKASYYNNFEALILADTGNYYSCLASQWLLCYSSTEYILKVEQCLNEEKARACRFLYPPSVDKLLETVHSQLIDQTANKLIEKRRAENQDLTTWQELLFRCANLSIQ